MTARFAMTLGTLAGATALGFALYLGLASTPLFAGVSIVFYRGLLLCALVAVVVAGSMAWAGRRRGGIDPALVIAAAMTSLSFNLAFLIILPVTIDRSISVFLLARIEAAETRRPLGTPALRRAFVDEYVGAMEQIERRVDEQTRSGTIETRGGRLRLTARGRGFMRLARALAWLYGTDPRFVGSGR